MNNQFTWKPGYIKKETEHAVTIGFDTGTRSFQYEPGQFVNITLLINGKPVTRSYSLSSAPMESLPSVTVKKNKNGLMSTYIFNEADTIGEWEIDGPHGFFYPDARAAKASSVVFIGGGSGITPLYAQLKHLLQNTDKRLILINVNRNMDEAIFFGEISNLAKMHPDRLTVIDFFTQVMPAEPGTGYRFHGRPGKLLLRKLLVRLLGDTIKQAFFFICGPAALTGLSEQVARSLEVPAENIYREFFGKAETDEPETILPDIALEVILQHANEQTTLEVKPRESILHAALEAGLQVRHSCKRGYCGSCIGRLLQGEVHMKENYALHPGQVEQGYVLLCQSFPLSNKTLVRVDSLR